MQGKIYLIPSALSNENIEVIPEYVKQAAKEVDIFLAENERSCRRYLRKIGIKTEFDESNLKVLDKKTSPSMCKQYIKFAIEGNNLGVVSEAGCPCIADPGSHLITLAHEMKIHIQPLVGPSSIVLALMGSGFNGQNFTFHGYLNVKSGLRKKELKKLEIHAERTGQTQIFMETPYRNLHLYEDILQTCNDETKLCMAVDLTSVDESIKTMKIVDWRRQAAPQIHKRPAIFLLQV